jgi:hypothetical protein
MLNLPSYRGLCGAALIRRLRITDCDVAQVIGSVEWQQRKEKKAARDFEHYDRAGELQYYYRRLATMRAAVSRLTTHKETASGRQVAPEILCVMELEFALARPAEDGGLADDDRFCFAASIIDGADDALIALFHPSGRTIKPASVRAAVSRATRRLVAMIYEPMPTDTAGMVRHRRAS